MSWGVTVTGSAEQVREAFAQQYQTAVVNKAPDGELQNISDSETAAVQIAELASGDVLVTAGGSWQNDGTGWKFGSSYLNVRYVQPAAKAE